MLVSLLLLPLPARPSPPAEQSFSAHQPRGVRLSPTGEVLAGGAAARPHCRHLTRRLDARSSARRCKNTSARRSRTRVGRRCTGRRCTSRAPLARPLDLHLAVLDLHLARALLGAVLGGVVLGGVVLAYSLHVAIWCARQSVRAYSRRTTKSFTSKSPPRECAPAPPASALPPPPPSAPADAAALCRPPLPAAQRGRRRPRRRRRARRRRVRARRPRSSMAPRYSPSTASTAPVLDGAALPVLDGVDSARPRRRRRRRAPAAVQPVAIVAVALSPASFSGGRRRFRVGGRPYVSMLRPCTYTSPSDSRPPV